MASSPTGTASSTLAVINPTTKRLKAVLNELAEFVSKNGDDRQRRMQRVLSIVVDEAVEEMGEVDEGFMRAWLFNMAKVIEWTSTGNMSILPPELIEFACKVEGIDPRSLFTVDESGEEEDSETSYSVLVLGSADIAADNGDSMVGSPESTTPA
jgi:hypothetical protein